MARRRTHGSGSIQPRSEGAFRIRVHAGNDPVSGRPRRHEETFRGTRKEAERRVRELLTKLDHGIDVSPEKLTTADWLVRWLAGHKADGRISEATHGLYQGILQNHLVPAIGAIRLSDLRADHLIDLKGSLLADGGTAARPLSASAVREIFVVLRQALNQAVTVSLVQRNPVLSVRVPAVRRDHEQRALVAEEIKQLLAAASETRLDAPIRVALATGLRQGELLALRWDDIRFEAAVLHVERKVRYISGQGHVVSAPKTANSRRTIELSAATIASLRAHRTAQRAERLRLGVVWQENGLVFPSSTGTTWIARNFYRSYVEVVGRSGIASAQAVHFHTLRHTAASQWIRAGADIFSVSRRLGHASASFTMDVYAHLLSGQQTRAAEALDHLLSGS